MAKKIIGRAVFDNSIHQTADLKRKILEVCEAKNLPIIDIDVTHEIHVSFDIVAKDKIEALNKLKAFAYSLAADLKKFGELEDFYLVNARGEPI